MATAALAGAQAASSLIGGIASGKGAKSAAKIAQQTAAQNRDFAQQTLAPFTGGGTAATEQLRRLLGLGDSNTGTSGYTADQQQQGALSSFFNNGTFDAERDAGIKALGNSFAARGALQSGAAQKAVYSYGDQFASSKLNTYISQLGGLASQGAGAAGALTGYVTDANNSAGTAAANSAIYQGQNVGNVLNGLTGALGQYAGQSSYGKSTSGVLGAGGYTPSYGSQFGNFRWNG